MGDLYGKHRYSVIFGPHLVKRLSPIIIIGYRAFIMNSMHKLKFQGLLTGLLAANDHH